MACPDWRREQDRWASRSAGRRIFLLGTPIHDNLGDHLIALSELAYLQSRFPDDLIIEIPTEAYMLQKDAFVGSLAGNDVVMVTGGGWMGDAWPSDELIVRDIVERVSPIARVLILPQTVHYAATSGDFWNESIAFWSTQDQVTICVRERDSYQTVVRDLGTGEAACRLVPDFGLIYPQMKPYCSKGNLAYVCLRRDKESILRAEDERNLLAVLDSKGCEVQEVSTLSNRVIPPGKRAVAVTASIEKFAQASLVITDRLHGMIISVLAGTPCIVLDNATGKVRGVYDAWMAEYGGVRYCSSMADVLGEVDDAVRNGFCIAGLDGALSRLRDGWRSVLDGFFERELS